MSEVKLPDWFMKVQAVWATIGSLLIVLGFNTPEWLAEIFSQAFIDQVAAVMGSVIIFVQFVRSIFAAKEPAEVTSLSVSQKLKYAINPFKLRA